MNIIFFTVSDQHNNPLGKFADLHCNFDWSFVSRAFSKMPFKCTVFDYFASCITDGPLEMEKSVIKLVRHLNAQLIIVPIMYYEISHSLLQSLRNIGCRSVAISLDDSMRFNETNRFLINSFDYYVTHESSHALELYTSLSVNAWFFPIFPSIQYYNEIISRMNNSSVECANDVIFIGAKIADRGDYIDYLHTNGINISVFGKGWDNGVITTENMIHTYHSSKICLNFIKTIDNSGRVQFKGRIFEIIMAGGFVLTEHSDEISEYFNIGHEIDTFRTPSELLDKIKYYLANDNRRSEMAARASAKAAANYSFESSWTNFITNVQSGVVKQQVPKSDYQVPSSAIDGFINWNYKLIYGRLILGQWKLLRQQYEFCRRELKALNCNISIPKQMIKRGLFQLITSLRQLMGK